MMNIHDTDNINKNTANLNDDIIEMTDRNVRVVNIIPLFIWVEFMPMTLLSSLTFVQCFPFSCTYMVDITYINSVAKTL